VWQTDGRTPRRWLRPRKNEIWYVKNLKNLNIGILSFKGFLNLKNLRFFSDQFSCLGKKSKFIGRAQRRSWSSGLIPTAPNSNFWLRWWLGRQSSLISPSLSILTCLVIRRLAGMEFSRRTVFDREDALASSHLQWICSEQWVYNICVYDCSLFMLPWLYAGLSVWICSFNLVRIRTGWH